MAIEIDIRIIGEATWQVVQDLKQFADHLSSGLGVVSPAPNPEKGNGADTVSADTVVDTADSAAPSTDKKPRAKKAPATEQAKLDRAAIIDGLTKIYSKGDENVRLAITKFRDGQGADRLRDLKDDALPAAAELLTELRLSGDQPAV